MRLDSSSLGTSEAVMKAGKNNKNTNKNNDLRFVDMVSSIKINAMCQIGFEGALW